MTEASNHFSSLTRHFPVAVALVTSLLTVAACSHKPTLTADQQAQADLAAYQTQIRKIVVDPMRVDQLVALTNEFQKLARQEIADLKVYRAKVAALNANYEATRADYEAVFAKQDAARETIVHKAGALREQMAALTTDQEWDQLGKTRLKLTEADLRQLLPD